MRNVEFGLGVQPGYIAKGIIEALRERAGSYNIDLQGYLIRLRGCGKFYEPRGRGFESCRARQLVISKPRRVRGFVFFRAAHVR